MGNHKDIGKAKAKLIEANALLWEAWELLPDNKARKELTDALQAARRALWELVK